MSKEETTKEETEEEFQMIDKQDLPRGSVLKPCQLRIEVLKDKYKGVKLSEVIQRYQQLTSELMNVQIALRELNILEGFKKMTGEQQALQLLYEPSMEILKQYAGHNNIVSITRHDDIYNDEENFGENFPFKFKFYHTLEEALVYTDTLPVDIQETMLISPLFLAL